MFKNEPVHYKLKRCTRLAATLKGTPSEKSWSEDVGLENVQIYPYAGFVCFINTSAAEALFCLEYELLIRLHQLGAKKADS